MKKSSNSNGRKHIYIKVIISVVVLLLAVVGGYYGYTHYKDFLFPPIPTINSVSISKDNKMLIKFSVPENNKYNKIYCIFKNNEEIPTVDDPEWTLSENNECSYSLSNERIYVYLKNENNVIYDVENSSTLGRVNDFGINKEQVYVAIKGTYSLTYEMSSVGYIPDNVTWYSEDEKIATVDEAGKITGIAKGNTVVHAKIMDKDVSTKVMVTDLITVRPKKYKLDRPYLPCGKYNKEENDILDAILKDRINDVGYKTRAGAVEAARFLALEFPYKIRYFSENGRLTINGVDGEGRYYHVGLYLDESRFAGIKKKMNGPKTWGCQLYSRPSKGLRMNGFDCSGYISWVLLNGGFDVGDLGAGVTSVKDLTDFGKKTKFTADVVKSGKVKVGDLLSSTGPSGGHIAMIVGEDKDYYYVTESLWTPPTTAVVIIAYSKKTLFNRYYWVMLMDSYYKEDGKLTSLWY